ncbi:MAG: Asp23/Gls24 family envelope stress response protein [Ruminococcaceae bacterium]|nr:Asp23/Gls24 family envelope stress response protein [Oscillospiraceae bacterium]
MSENKINGVAVNNEAIVQIAGLAALEIEGVAGLAKRPVEIKSLKNAFKTPKTAHAKSIALTVDNGALILDVYLNVLDNVKVKTVAENVQLNVKDKVQSMTGSAVARVNVHVDDVTVAEAE